MAVRTAMEHHIGALPRTPFPASRDFPSRGNEKIGGTGYCVTYDTESQSRNADFISIARKGNPPPSEPFEPSEPFSPNVTLPHCITNWNKLPPILVPACSNSFQLVPRERIFTHGILQSCSTLSHLVPPLVPPDFSVTIGENRPMEQVEQDITYRDIQKKRGV